MPGWQNVRGERPDQELDFELSTPYKVVHAFFVGACRGSSVSKLVVCQAWGLAALHWRRSRTPLSRTPLSRTPCRPPLTRASPQAARLSNVTFESLQYSTLYEIEPLIVDIYTNCLFMASSSYGLPFAMTSHVGVLPLAFSVDLTRVGSVEVGLRPPTFRNLSASGSDSSPEANCTLVERTTGGLFSRVGSIAWTQQVTLSIGHMYSIHCMPQPSTIQYHRVGITAVYFPVVFFPSSQAGWTFTPNTSFMSIIFDDNSNIQLKKMYMGQAFWKAMPTYEAELEINDFPEYSRMMVSWGSVAAFGSGRSAATCPPPTPPRVFDDARTLHAHAAHAWTYARRRF